MTWLVARTASKLLVVLALAAACVSCSGQASASPCKALQAQANTGLDASALFESCLRSLAPGLQLALPGGTYRLARPVRIETRVVIATAGLAAADPGCGDLPAGRCATLFLDVQAGARNEHAMPIAITAGEVTMEHLIIRGAGQANRQRSYCRSQSTRPLGGGIRVLASGFTLRKSVLRDMTCYTALEVTSGADRVTVEENVVGPNGDHDSDEIWSDGVTIHDSAFTSVSRNLFVDNTDVQLILGGCRNCRIENNEFRHGPRFSSASFAELMLQAWPSTSGRFDATAVRANRIDCSVGARCGYGIMLGSAPWYSGPVSGGVVADNSIANAMIGLNIDSLSGPMQIRDNSVTASGGRFASECGDRLWPAINVSPNSRRFVRGNVADVASGSLSTSGCLLNRRPRG